VPEVAGTWKDLPTTSLHGVEPDRAGPQHRRSRDRDRRGDLFQKITVDVRAKSCCSRYLNTMVEQLRSSREVTRGRARKSEPRGVGRSGRVPGVGGTWKT